MSNMKYPLTTVVQKVLEKIHGGAQAVAGNFEADKEDNSVATRQFSVFSYQRDFNVLWGLHGENSSSDKGLEQFAKNVILESHGKELTLVVIWDGMPESDGSPMNVGRYVTPYDWAVMFSYLLFKLAKEKQQYPHVRIFILDLKSQDYSGCFGVKALNLLHSQFPWIQIYRPVGNAAVTPARCASPIGGFGLDDFVSDAQNLKLTLSTFHDGDNVDRLDYLRTAIQLWAANLIQPGDRHSVANLIGPIILANGFESGADIVGKITEASSLRGALVELMLATDLLAMGKNNYSDPAMLPSNDDKFGRQGNLHFVLVDDQYALGFHHVLSKLIFGKLCDPCQTTENGAQWHCAPSQGLGISCYSGADAMLQIISADGVIKDWDEPRYLELPSKGNVLLLDLRLWTDDSQKNSFFKSLIKVCDDIKIDLHAGCLKENSLDFDPHFKKAYDAIQNRGTQDETATLVFLPLLLSYYDPSLPIVIFSSTHQRAVIEMVSHRPNIITDFSKPIFGNYVQAVDCGEILRDLRKALVKAIELHESRVIWERIVSFVNLKIPAPILFTAVEKTDVEKHKTTTRTFYNVPPNKKEAFKDAFESNKYICEFGEQKELHYKNLETIYKLLAEYYQHYILRQAFFDFITIPWEFIECNLFKHHEDDNGLKGKAFLNDFGDLTHFPNAGGATVLKEIRNKKAHGEQMTRKNAMPLCQWRWLGIIEFMVFLDFLSQRGSDTKKLPNFSAAQWGGVQKSHRMSDILNILKKQEKLLCYSSLLVLKNWELAPQSFSDTTKDVLRAFFASSCLDCSLLPAD